jgi:hypothetical protein
MRSYEFRVPRALTGLAAAAATALTFGVLVILPASMASGGGEHDMLAAANGAVARCVTAAAQPRLAESRTTDTQHCLHTAREWLTTN